MGYNSATSMVFDLTVGILNDFFALMLIMGLHYRNFRDFSTSHEPNAIYINSVVLI